MNREEKLKKLSELKAKASELKIDVDYYNSLQLALKLVLNGSYGAFATPYFILYNNNVAGTITAEGRELTRTMDEDNQDYWYNIWHNDTITHERMYIKNVKQIDKKENVSIYGDTDSIFVSFKPAMDSCDWKNQIFNDEYLSTINKKFIVLSRDNVKIDNPNMIGFSNNWNDFQELLKGDYELILMDGYFIKNRSLIKMLKDNDIKSEIQWNWSSEVDFIIGLDHLKYDQYFVDCLDRHAGSYGIKNKESFELERISESVINIAKKKYIQHILFEDGIPYDRLDYIYPKGVELVRSSTPAFARDKIVDIVKYLFSHPDTFNIKDLLKLVKGLRKEFELADIDDIAMQTSCNKYDEKVINDKSLPLQFELKTHFAVKAGAYHNYLLYQNKSLMNKYELIKSGTKIKYYVCKNKNINEIFAYTRGSYPIEIAPEIDYDIQFEKSILSPINSIIEPLGLPEITRRLSVVMDIFAGFK